MWAEIGYVCVQSPSIRLKRLKVRGLKGPSIFEGIICEKCGELTMKTRVKFIDGNALCLSCLGDVKLLLGGI